MPCSARCCCVMLVTPMLSRGEKVRFDLPSPPPRDTRAADLPPPPPSRPTSPDSSTCKRPSCFRRRAAGDAPLAPKARACARLRGVGDGGDTASVGASLAARPLLSLAGALRRAARRPASLNAWLPRMYWVTDDRTLRHGLLRFSRSDDVLYTDAASSSSESSEERVLPAEPWRRNRNRRGSADSPCLQVPAWSGAMGQWG